MVALALAAACTLALAGEPSADELAKEFLGQTPAVERTPQQLEAAYAKVLDSLAPNMGSEDPGKRQGPEQTLQAICWYAGRPGAEAHRLAVCKAMVARLGGDLPKLTRVWLIKQLEHIGAAEAVERLGTLLADAEPRIRERARRALQNNPDPKATGTLLAALGKARDAKWRVALINAIACREDAAALKPLLGQAGDGNDDVRSAAVGALARIGDKAATAAIAAARTKGSGKARNAATDAALALADRLCRKGDKATALGIYRGLLEAKGHLRCAAIVGIGRAGGLKELETIFTALADADPQVRGAGLSALGLLPAREVNQAMTARIKSADAATKVLLLRALADGRDPESLPTFLAAAKDADAAVRIAAYQGMGDLANPAAAAALVAVVAKAEGKELIAARAAVDRIPGDPVTAALTAALATAPPAGRVQLVQSLAARRTKAVVPTFLKCAQDPDAAVRAEALKALANLAEIDAAPTLVGFLVKATDKRERQAAANTVAAVCRRSDDVEARVAPLLAAIPGASADARVALVQVLGRLGGTKALAAVRAALKDSSPEVQDAAFRALPSWVDLGVANELLAIAKSQAPLPRRVVALRGAVEVAGKLGGQPPATILKLYQDAMAAAPRPEDRKLVLGGMAGTASLGALDLAVRYLADPALQAEAEVAASRIARGISGSHKAKAREVCQKLADSAKQDRVRREAKETIALIERFDDYITAWEVSPPYTAAGKEAQALIGVVFPPEKPDDKTTAWKPMKVGTTPTRPWLLEFNRTIGGNDRAVYVRTRVYSPKAQPALMELGSDDGVKVWLNDKVVHTNNATRPCSPGQDKAKVALERGWNTLRVKVTQGGGEWALCLRFRAPDGKPLEGVRADPAGE